MSYLSKNIFSLFVLTTLNTVFSNEISQSSHTNTLMVNSPAKIAVKRAWDFNLTGTFIYWTAKEEGIAVALVNSFGGVPDVLKNYPVNSSFHPGFKIALPKFTDFLMKISEKQNLKTVNI